MIEDASVEKAPTQVWAQAVRIGTIETLAKGGGGRRGYFATGAAVGNRDYRYRDPGGASGAWAGQANGIAIWSDGGWRFAAPRRGLRVLRLSDGAWLRFEADAWVIPGMISLPETGVIVDSEARSTLVALILLLEAQGLLISG